MVIFSAMVCNKNINSYCFSIDDERSIQGVLWQKMICHVIGCLMIVGPHYKPMYLSVWIAIIKIQWLWDHIFFITGIIVLVRWCLYIKIPLVVISLFHILSDNSWICGDGSCVTFCIGVSVTQFPRWERLCCVQPLSIHVNGHSLLMLALRLTENILRIHHLSCYCNLGPLLLTWFNFNPTMDK